MPPQDQQPSSATFAPTDLLSSVKDVIRNHLRTSDLAVDTIAKACGFTVSALNRRLAKQGVTLSVLIAEMRLETAERKLLTSKRSIGEIAGDLGYSDATAFTRAFRAWTGQSPSKFRQEHKRPQNLLGSALD